MLTPEQLALHQPECQLQKFCALKAPTDSTRKTLILALPHIPNSPPLHQKFYSEMILFYALNVLKLKLFICSFDEGKNPQLQFQLLLL